MAEQATRRQRSEELTPQEKTQGRMERPRQGQGQGMERYRGGRDLPSIFSVSPGEFFTLSPITLMRRLTEDIDRAFSGLTSGAVSAEGFSWVPTVEVQQSGNNLIVRADLPGLNENDVRLEATEDGLTMEGERKQEEEREEGGVYRSERVYGRFRRFIPLPEGAKVDQAQANFRNGVLQVTIPVPESQQNRRQIPISTSAPAQSSSSQQASSGSQSRTATSGSNR